MSAALEAAAPCYGFVMVASSAFGHTWVLCAVLAGVTSAGGCGGESAHRAQAGGSAGRPEEIELDGPPCDTRRAADCTGITSENSSGSSTFVEAPELSECSKHVSFDGCGKLIYSFDVDGCAVSVGPGPGGWKDSAHLAPLRDCLSSAFNDARFSCMASKTLSFYESCFIR